jgi:hypothetical protein
MADANGRPNHIEDVLVHLHDGAWFGWSNSKSKVYANLVIHSTDEKPTESELTTELASQQAAYDAKAYARTRETTYPSIGEQLDMLWHAVDTGDWTPTKVKTTEFYTALKAVKDANPKP